MIPWWWSWLLTIIGVIALWNAGSKRKVGWLIGIFAQLLWFTYAVTTQQYGFVLGTICYGSVYVRNYLKWRREERAAKYLSVDWGKESANTR